MNRLFRLWFFAAILTGLLGSTTLAAAAPSPRILLDGLPLSFPVPPQIIQDRTMVPFRAIAEALGVEVEWRPDLWAVDARGMDREVRLTIGDRRMYVNGQVIELDVPPMIVNDRTLVPLRAFSTAFLARVGWDQATFTVSIESPVRPMRTLAFYALRSYPEKDLVPRFSDVAYGWSTLRSDGSLDLLDGEYRWPTPDGDVTGERLLAEAAAAGTRRYLMVQAEDGRVDLTGIVLDSVRIERVAATVKEVVEAKGFDGVLLDLESLGLNETGDDLRRVREGFAILVAAVARDMRAMGKETIVSVHPLNGWYDGYDYAALAAEADLLQVMAHDYRQDGNPEPAEQVIEAIELAVAAVGPKQKEKLLLGILTPYETPDTLWQKVGLAKRFGLGGVSFWRLGLVGEARMEALESSVQPLKATD